MLSLYWESILVRQILISNPHTHLKSALFDSVCVVRFPNYFRKHIVIMGPAGYHYKSVILKNYTHALITVTDVITGTMASQITSLAIVYSTIYSGADQRNMKLRVTGLFAGNSQMTSNAENVSIWWRHRLSYVLGLWSTAPTPFVAINNVHKSWPIWNSTKFMVMTSLFVLNPQPQLHLCASFLLWILPRHHSPSLATFANICI